MRISDWSSDVCSSELVGGAALLREGGALQGVGELGDFLAAVAARAQRVEQRQQVGDRIGGGFFAAERAHRPAVGHADVCPSAALPSAASGPSGRRSTRDRKSVVSGKSVSVRVDCGGGRVIKKK